MKARFFNIIMLIGALALTGVGGRSEAALDRSATGPYRAGTARVV